MDGVEEPASPLRRALVVAVVFVCLVGAMVVRQRLTRDDWDPVTADPALPTSAAALDFSTPDETLDNFLVALADGTYDLATEMLSDATLTKSAGQIDMSGFTTLRGEEAISVIDFGGIGNASFLPRHIGTEFMERAAGSGSFPIDLSGGIAERSTTVTDDSARVNGTLGNGLTVTVDLSRNDADEWRIDRVSTPGGDPDAMPFSAPPGHEPPVRAPDQMERYTDRFPMDDAETFAVTALRLVETGDFFSLERLLGSSAWMGTARGVSFDVEQLAVPAARTIFEGADFDDLRTLLTRWDGGVAELWRRADALDAMYVDPVGPYTVDDVGTGPPASNDPVSVVTVTDGEGTTYRVSVIDVGEHGWRLHQILADGGDPEIVPLSGPTGVEASEGTVVCWDHLRYDHVACDRQMPDELLPGATEIIEAARAGEIPGAGAAEIAALRAGFGPAEICATMQGYRDDVTFPPDAVELAPVIAAEICPGDPALLEAEG